MTLSIYIAITINKNILQYYLVLEKMPRTEARGIVFYINPSRIHENYFLRRYAGTPRSSFSLILGCTCWGCILG